MATPDAEPLTTAELDRLASLDAKRTPGPLRPGVVQRDRIFVPYADALEGPNGERVLLRMNEHFPAHVDDARAIAAALNALPALLAEVRASRLAAVEVRAVATALAEHEPCLACGCEDQEDSCLYHESHELSARLLAAVGAAK